MNRGIDVLTSPTLKNLRTDWWNEAFAEFLQETLRPKPGKQILDVGCGIGTAEATLARVSLFSLFDRLRLLDPETMGKLRQDLNGPFEDFPVEIWRQTLDVNVTGVFLCCQVFGKQMAGADGGSIVNVASIYGLVSPDQRVYEYRRRGGANFFKPAAYATSKSALLNLTRYLATYWAPRVRVNTVTFAGVFNDQDPEFLAEYTKRVPLGRMARPDEYNGAILFLASDASSYMTGANVVLDGGYTAW